MGIENDPKKYFSSRFSVRKFKKRSISDNLIREIIENSMRAPTCGNMQLYSIVITRDKEKKGKIEKLHFNQTAVTECDVILTICADFSRFTRWCNLKNANAGYDNFHSFITALTDAVIIAQQIVTLAEINGLGTCYLGTVNYNASQISELLKLPELVVPVASIALGYPDEHEITTTRLPIDAILHYETYRNDKDEEILNFYKSTEEFPANREFVEINKKENLAQIFTDIRYPKEMNESVSETFLSLLKEKKFL